MPKKILVVDDDPSVRELIRVTLRDYEVIECVNGLEALEKVEIEKPDLILLDVMMPKMNGFEVIRELRSSPSTVEVPILLLTARGDRSTLKRSQEEGVVTYFTKPFSPRALAQKVESVLAELGGSPE